MNLSLIHSLACAKYSIIKVPYILRDLTFRYLHASRITHPFNDLKKKNLSFLSAQTQEVVFYQVSLSKCS